MVENPSMAVGVPAAAAGPAPMTVEALKCSLGRHRRHLVWVLAVLGVLVAALAAAEVMLGNTVYPVQVVL